MLKPHGQTIGLTRQGASELQEAYRKREAVASARMETIVQQRGKRSWEARPITQFRPTPNVITSDSAALV